MHCTHCNHVMSKRVARDYKYEMSGLSEVVLHDVEKFHCAACGNAQVSFQAIGKLHRAIAHTLATKKTRLSSAEVKFLRDYLGASNQEFARAMGVTPYQSSRWMSGPMSESAARLLRMLVVGRDEDLNALRRVMKTIEGGTCEGKAALDARRVRGEWKIQITEV